MFESISVCLCWLCFNLWCRNRWSMCPRWSSKSVFLISRWSRWWRCMCQWPRSFAFASLVILRYSWILWFLCFHWRIFARPDLKEEVVHVPKVMQHERQHHFHVEVGYRCWQPSDWVRLGSFVRWSRTKEVVDVPVEQHIEQVVHVPVVLCLVLWRSSTPYK